MESKIKFSAGLGTFGEQSDRFCTSGYKGIKKTLEQLFSDASKVEDLSGIEILGGSDFSKNYLSELERLKEEYNIKISCLIVDIFTNSMWQKGSFTSIDKNIREKSIKEVKKFIDIAKGLDCNLINIWPGQDGYDYYFQSDYYKAWNYLIEGIHECAEYRKDIKIGLEFKLKEPRTHCYLSSIGKTLFLIDKINLDNVGIVLDVGHSIFAYENMAESVALCKLAKDKLFHLHLNDNYGYWDDDMMVGCIHIPEYLELLYWLQKTNYQGWYSLDIFPYRENGVNAANESIKMLKAMIAAVDSMNEADIEMIINEGDSTKSLSLIRKMIFNR